MEKSIKNYFNDYVIGIKYDEIDFKVLSEIMWNNLLSLDHRINIIDSYINHELKNGKKLSVFDPRTIINTEVVRKCEYILNNYEKIKDEEFIYKKTIKPKGLFLISSSLVKEYAYIMEDENRLLLTNYGFKNIEEAKNEIKDNKIKFPQFNFKEYRSNYH